MEPRSPARTREYITSTIYSSTSSRGPACRFTCASNAARISADYACLARFQENVAVGKWTLTVPFGRSMYEKPTIGNWPESCGRARR